MLRVKINDHDLFDQKNPCGRANRIDFNDQKLSFAMCNNVKLEGARVCKQNQRCLLLKLCLAEKRLGIK